MIFFLVKVFTKEDHANKFLRGELYARRLSWLKGIECDEVDDERRDEYEAAVMPQLENLRITLGSKDAVTGEVEKFTISKEDLAAPPIFQLEHFDHINIFCMYAANSREFEQVSEDNLQAFRTQLELPKDCLKFGRYAVVITNTQEFLRRVKAATHRIGYKICRGLVKYYDPEVGTPLGPLDIRIIFTKRKKFSHEREFRFAIDTGTLGSEPITLNIGGIDDIAIRMYTADINRELSISLGEVEGQNQKDS